MNDERGRSIVHLVYPVVVHLTIAHNGVASAVNPFTVRRYEADEFGTLIVFSDGDSITVSEGLQAVTDAFTERSRPIFTSGD